MKKTYISPICEEIHIATMTMLAASNTSLNLNVDEEESDVNKLLSREYDF